LTVEFTVAGVPCIGLNGGPQFKHGEAFSFQIATDDQEQTDRYWNAIVGNGGQESQCGWCKATPPLGGRAAVPDRDRTSHTRGDRGRPRAAARPTGELLAAEVLARDAGVERGE
jgi:hypothetical protein